MLACQAIQVSAQGVKLSLDLFRTAPDNYQHHNDQDGRREENRVMDSMFRSSTGDQSALCRDAVRREKTEWLVTLLSP